MSQLARLALIHSDPRAVAALRFGFEREGVEVVAAAADPGSQLGGEFDLVVAGGASEGDGRAALTRARAEAPTPILYVGNGVHRDEALAAGATEVLDVPTYARDVVTVARLVASAGRHPAGVASGSLGADLGLFYVVRAAMATGFGGVLTLVRGLRRGELRFYEGEVTSAQVGGLHGLPALHQLLLWTDARFELRREDVVRRRQIPLEPHEIVADAQRFLREFEVAAADLSPSALYCASSAFAELPAPIADVRELFEGGQTLADAIEDSPYRVLETLAIARQLCALNLVVVGDEDAPVDAEAVAAVDWSGLLPSGSQSEDGVSQVVPSSAAAGEIGVAAAPASGPSGDAGEGSTVVVDESLAAAADEVPEAAPVATTVAPTKKMRALAPAPGGFSDAEEAFFSRGSNLAEEQELASSFDDLDADYELPDTFWKRFFSRPDAPPRKKKD